VAGSFAKRSKKHWLPALGRFKPEMIFISAGFDAHRDDDMASLSLVESDYAWVTGRIKEIAEQHGKGRIVSTLERRLRIDRAGTQRRRACFAC